MRNKSSGSSRLFRGWSGGPARSRTLYRYTIIAVSTICDSRETVKSIKKEVKYIKLKYIKLIKSLPFLDMVLVY